jgi:hypothetical protein
MPTKYFAKSMAFRYNNRKKNLNLAHLFEPLQYLTNISQQVFNM